MIQTEPVERRRYKRTPLTECALVFNDTIFGEVVDISRGGLAFKYIEEQHLPIGEQLELDIMCTTQGVLIKKIPCRTVSSIPIEIEENSSDKKNMKKCGAEITFLTAEQAALFRHFES